MNLQTIETIAFFSDAVQVYNSYQPIRSVDWDVAHVTCPVTDLANNGFVTENYWCNSRHSFCKAGNVTLRTEDLASLGVTENSLNENIISTNSPILFCLAFICSLSSSNSELTCEAQKHIINFQDQPEAEKSADSLSRAPLYYWLIFIISLLAAVLISVVIGYSCGTTRSTRRMTRKLATVVERHKMSVTTTQSSAHSNPMYDGTMSRAHTKFTQDPRTMSLFKNDIYDDAGAAPSSVAPSDYSKPAVDDSFQHIYCKPTDETFSTYAVSNMYDIASPRDAPQYDHMCNRSVNDQEPAHSRTHLVETSTDTDEELVYGDGGGGANVSLKTKTMSNRTETSVDTWDDSVIYI